MEFKTFAEAQTRKKLKLLKNNDGEFTSKEFKELLKAHGIEQ
jgi:hypothetical protein